jgi:hypothetical protein
MVYFKVLHQNLPEGTEEKHKQFEDGGLQTYTILPNMRVCAHIWNLLVIQLLFQSNIYTYDAVCFYWLKFKTGNTEFEDIILAIFANTKI